MRDSRDSGFQAGSQWSVDSDGFVSRFYTLALRNLESLCGGDSQASLTQDLEIGIIYHRLGHAFYELERLEQAASSYSLALKNFKFRYGDEHQSIADILNDFGVTRSEQGQHLNAIALFERALEIYKGNANDTASGIANVLNNLGNALYDVCEPSAAIRKYTAAIEIYEALSNDIAVGNTLRNVGMAYERMGRFKEAEDMYWKALRRFGPGVNVVQTLSNIADSYASRRDYPEAIKYFQICITAKQNRDRCANVAAELNEIGHCYASMGMLDEACDASHSALITNVAAHGWFHATVANTFNNIGNAYLIAQIYDIALDNFKRALGIARMLSENRADVETMADIIHNIGLVYRFQGRHVDSIRMLKEAIDHYDQMYGCGHVKSAESVHNLGSTLNDYGFQEEAIEQFGKAEKLYRDAYGECYIEIADVLHDLSTAYKIQGSFEDATQALQKGCKIYEKNLGVDHDQTRDALGQLAVWKDLYGRRG
jgi:tetratricopeptide (TPR) repeat protein